MITEATEQVRFVVLISLDSESPETTYVAGKMLRSSIICKTTQSITMVMVNAATVEVVLPLLYLTNLTFCSCMFTGTVWFRFMR